MFRTVLKVTSGGVVLSGVGVAAYLGYDEGARRSAKICAELTPIGLSYYWNGVTGSKSTSELHKEMAPRVYKIVVHTGGYYVKVAQTLVGSGMMAPEYETVFADLLDNCPSKDFATIKKIVEEELKCPMENVFSSFAENPLGSASIGQAHMATLKKTGEPVVVKVQYPDVERFFRVDFKTFKLLCRFGDFGDDIDRVMDEIAATFDVEFDYRREADILNQASENLSKSKYSKVAQIPKPYNELCTRKLLVMERVEGRPIRSYIKDTLNELGAERGMTGAEYMEMLKEEFKKDPEKMTEYLSEAPVSESVMDLYIWYIHAKDCVWNVFRFLSGRELKWSSTPLNGPRITNTLFEIHGEQIFKSGLFNSDPHAGNVIVSTDGGKLGLIDYGAASQLTREQQKAFADLIVALDKGDDDATIQAFLDSGVKTKNQDRHFLLSYATIFFHRGFHKDDLERLNLPKNPEMLDIHLAKFDKFEYLPGHLVMLQRCAMVLQGVANDTGTGGVAISKMWRKSAESFV